MWWDRSKPAEVYLADHRVGMALAPSTAPRWFDTADLDESLQRLAVWLASEEAAGVGKLRAWLSGSLARPYLVPAASGARNPREAHALAAAMAPDATGVSGDLRVWLDRWRADRPTPAVAIAETVWQRLHASVAAAHDLRRDASNGRRRPTLTVASVRPWWNLPVDRLLQDSRRDASRIGWSLVEGDGLLHGVIDGGQVVEIDFDRPGAHDASGDMLRRRLQANWGAGTRARDLAFDPAMAVAPASTHAIGSWRDLSGGAA